MIENFENFKNPETSDTSVIYEKMNYCGNGVKYDFTIVPTKNGNQGILKDLEQYSIPQDVKEEANKIYKSLNISIKRGKRRKRVIFFCLFHAFHRLGQTKDPKQLADLLGISPTEATKASVHCTEELVEYYSPIDFLENIIESVGLDKSTCLEEIKALIQKVIEKDSEIQEFYPQVVAAAVVLFYMISQGYSVNRKEFSKRVRRSEMTINKVFRKVWKICNDDI